MSSPSTMGTGTGTSLLLGPLCCQAGAVCITMGLAQECVTHLLAISRAGGQVFTAQGLTQAHPAARQQCGHSLGTAEVHFPHGTHPGR